MDDVRQKVWKARKFIREIEDVDLDDEDPYSIYDIRFYSSSPVQISEEHWEKYQETEGYGYGEMNYYDGEDPYNPPEEDLGLKYGILVVEERMVSYECMPKDWDATAKCYFSEKWFE